MDNQLTFLHELGKKYTLYSTNDDALYEAINNIEEEILQEIYEEYVDVPNFQPMNLVRCTVARQLLDGGSINADDVKSIMNDILERKTERFSFMPEAYLVELKGLPKKNSFKVWNKSWKIFYTFFFRGKIKQTTDQYLEQLGSKVIIDLQLLDYQFHTVNFQGPQNFGSNRSWIAIYPTTKESHREAYQFFIGVTDYIEAGIHTGSGMKDDSITDVSKVNDYEGVIALLKSKKAIVEKQNNLERNYFKFSPGKGASKWDEFREKGMAALSYYDTGVGDLSAYNSREELNVAIDQTPDDVSNNAWNLWLFKSAKVGDVVFASRGRSAVVGIGVIAGEYEYNTDREDLFYHTRKVNWFFNKVYEYKKNKIDKFTLLFRADTFSPTKQSQFIFNEYVRLYPEVTELFDEHDIKYQKFQDDIDAKEVENFDDNEEGENPEPNYWWLNANPKIWSLDKLKVGESQEYTTHNDKGNKRRIYKYFAQARQGDLILGYESTPTKKLKAILEVQKGIHQNKEGKEVISFVKTQNIDHPIPWSALKGIRGLENMDIFINNQGSLFKVEQEEYEIIQAIIDEKNEEADKNQYTVTKYGIEHAMKDLFMSESDFTEICSLLSHKKNIILQGAPGVGKTFIADKLAKYMMGVDDPSRIEFVQFHQSYSYEDFIQGYRPDGDGQFSLQNGVFFDLCDKARNNEDRSYFIIIDEINRGNLSKIFGELMMLIESDKRNVAISLTYSQDGYKFSIPKNLHIIGTMNTADRSLAMVDYALRRRFAFIDMVPVFDARFTNFLASQKVAMDVIDHIVSKIGILNKTIAEDNALGDGFCIGHSFFCSRPEDIDDKDWYRQVVKNEISPIVKEYYFDNKQKADKLIQQLKID